jgi:hypothetical protein
MLGRLLTLLRDVLHQRSVGIPSAPHPLRARDAVSSIALGNPLGTKMQGDGYGHSYLWRLVR